MHLSGANLRKKGCMSTTFGPEEAQAYLHKLLKVMHHTGGSDLFISADFPPSIKSQGAMKPLSQQKLTGSVTRALALSIMNEKQKREFEACLLYTSPSPRD